MSYAASIPPPSQPDPLLVIAGLTKSFAVERDLFGRPTKWFPAVENVTLSVRRGETLGLVGESGSGKSTLARLILRLMPATSGRVCFDGVNVLEAPPADLQRFRQQAQIIFQDPFGSLDPRMKVNPIVSEGMGHLHLSTKEKRARVGELLDLVHLPADAMDRYPHEFSGGQRQRISIARALAVNPEFIVADEPVSALDVSMQSQILNLLQELRARLRLTYILISHDMSVVRYMADRVAVMYLGRIVEVGPVQEVFEDPVHPYTQALISSVPSLVRGDHLARIRVPDEARSAPDRRSACVFAGRCFRSIDVCRRAVPVLEPVRDGSEHLAACFNPGPIEGMVQG